MTAGRGDGLVTLEPSRHPEGPGDLLVAVVEGRAEPAVRVQVRQEQGDAQVLGGVRAVSDDRGVGQELPELAVGVRP